MTKSILMNLKENKTIFHLCECKSEVLAIEYDHDWELADISIYETANSFKNKMSLWQRLRYSFKVLWSGYSYNDQMQLSKQQLKELADFINQEL